MLVEYFWEVFGMPATIVGLKTSSQGMVLFVQWNSSDSDGMVLEWQTIYKDGCARALKG